MLTICLHEHIWFPLSTTIILHALQMDTRRGHKGREEFAFRLHTSAFVVLELVEIQVCVTKTFAFNEVCLQ